MMTQSLRENTWPSSQVCTEGGCQEAEPDGRGPEELGFIYLEVRLSITGAAGTAHTRSTHACTCVHSKLSRWAHLSLQHSHEKEKGLGLLALEEFVYSDIIKSTI